MTTHKIAEFECMKYGSKVIGTDSWEGYDSYVRITEYVEIEFPPLAEAEVVNEKIRSLTEAKKEVLVKAEQAVQKIEDEIGKLLCLDAPEENV